MDDSEKGTPVATDASSQQKEGDLSQQLGSQPTAHDATGRKHRRKRGGRKHRSASAKPEESISMDQQDEGGIGTERQDEGGMRSPQDPEARPAKRFSPGNFRGQTSAGEEGVVHPVPSARTRDKRVGMPAEGSGSAPLRGDKPAEGRGNAPPRGETPVSPTSAKVLGAANHWRGQSEASGQRWAGQRRQHERPVRAARADEETDAPAARSAGQIGESGKQGRDRPDQRDRTGAKNKDPDMIPSIRSIKFQMGMSYRSSNLADSDIALYFEEEKVPIRPKWMSQSQFEAFRNPNQGCERETFKHKTWKPPPSANRGKETWGGTLGATGGKGTGDKKSDVDLSNTGLWGLTTVEECSAARFDENSKPESEAWFGYRSRYKGPMKKMPAEGVLYYFNYLEKEELSPQGATVTGLWRFLTGRMGHTEPPPEEFVGENCLMEARERREKLEDEERQWNETIARHARKDRDRRGLEYKGPEPGDGLLAPGYLEWFKENYLEQGDFTKRERAETGVRTSKDGPGGEGHRDLARWLRETADMANDMQGPQDLVARLETAADLADKLAHLSLWSEEVCSGENHHTDDNFFYDFEDANDYHQFFGDGDDWADAIDEY
eukprot:CAMPEP_0181340490 /NCGR_PEP_ID=MMETSP1101-20121128/29869_1 /TAXON_ID=46948 /ORGANISM="Rhodomonas abbreviata, Strain Caron Lab Isolate" /LENGTH=606 /DNA_ID=CAMNT_0023451633 /DNA_START=206 /DNA_END=2026 /DNA_ORIENTATION=-